MRIYAAIVAAALAGCMTTPADLTKASPEQIREIVRDRAATVSCGSAKTVTGNVTFVFANLDEVKGLAGTVTVDANCVTTITGEPRAASVPAPAAPTK